MADLDLIIFDCDGTLIDSEFLAAQIESEQLRQAGFDIPVEEFAERFAGMTTKNIMMEVERQENIPLQATLLEETHDILNRRIPAEATAIEGAADALKKITTQMCVCSNSPESRLEMMLTKNQLIGYFGDRIYSSRNVGEKRPKPHPDVFLYAIDVLDAEPDYTIVIEDSESGVKAARAAGARVIGFTGASHSYPSHSDKLIDAGAETVINRMSDLPQMIEVLAEWTELK
ncbi:HAD family hydrolase [Lentilitoribacter sp. EG35]|uniref:HAD family hydrolase n=1 Tax=Lentilitoribacter sp. EG35 TaxID=3234192 RepID=UPI0034616B68